MLSTRITPVARAALVIGLAVLPRVASGQSWSVVPDGLSVGMTRYELQRSLAEMDEQRRKLEASLEPVDSVLRVLSADTAHIATLKRAPIVDRDVTQVRSLLRQLRLSPGSPEITARLIGAINTTTHDFSVAESGLGARVLVGSSGEDILSRAPNAGVVAIEQPLPPYDTPLWDKVRQSDYGRQRLTPITDDDFTAFRFAVSDTGFLAYKSVLTDAFTRRLSEIKQTRDASRADILRLRRRAAELAHEIGAQDESSGQLDGRLIAVALPVFAFVLLVLLLAPRVYRSPELQSYIFSSGLLLEITTLVLVTGTVLVLGLGGRIHAEVIGTLLGALSGFALGRSVPRRGPEIDAPVRTVVVAPPDVVPLQPLPQSPPPAPPAPPLRPGRFR